MSDVSVDIIKNRSGEAPDLPSGANLSGVSTAATLQVTNLNPTHINASGVTTATTFSGSLKSTGTPTLGLGVTINSSGINISGVATAGIVSATTLYGDGSNLTGVAMSIAPVSYNPDVNDSTVPKASGIGLTFTERVIAGSGNITLRKTSASGTVVENFAVGSDATIINNTVSIDPTSDLTQGETYHISYPSGAFTNTSGDVSYVGTAYTFGVKPEFVALWGWGANEYGNLGINNVVNYSSPVQLPGTWTDEITSHTGGFYAIKSGGTLWAWGNQPSGGLGVNDTVRYSSPVQVPGTTWETLPINAASNNLAAVKTDGTLWVAGENSAGQLGQNNVIKYSSPVQIPGTTWSRPHVGNVYNGAIKTDGTLWTWGAGIFGETGHNSRTYYSSPVQVPGTTWRRVIVDQRGSLATKTDGTLWAWGYNGTGRLGQGSPGNNHYSSPAQIPGTTWSINAVLGTNHAAAIRTDGTLWTWGDNSSGQLGQNDRTNQLSPVQVPGTTWNKIGAVEYAIVATKTDGTLWSWGYAGTKGQLGQNNLIKYSSPTQIPGTDWNGRVISNRGAAPLVGKVT